MKLHGSALRLTIFIGDTRLVILDDVEVIRYTGQTSDRPRKERRR